ncbi:hypothetical protein [Yoonia sp.]|uniref:hypothetical protein n=1 Tax=Yoonia sp. TaxID=2212373 RepID=UPI001A0F1C36|nr:hypothetical protein [Yoonia sp.]MBE0412014.1 hypothetical protein [Yoonia sp.]
MRWVCFALFSLFLAGCAKTPPTPEEAAETCEKRAQAAQAPEVGVTIGASSSDGPFASASIGLSADLLRGRDPIEVYQSCVINLTGQLPIRPPRLRAL